MLEKPNAVIAAIVAMFVTQIIPLLTSWGVPEELAREIASWGGATIWALSALLWYVVTNMLKLREPASIVVGLIESVNPGMAGAEKRAQAVAKLEALIDDMKINWVSKKVLKLFAGNAIDSVVAVTKDLLYKQPPKIKVGG